MHLWIVLVAFALAAAAPFMDVASRGGDHAQNIEEPRDAADEAADDQANEP